MSFCASTRAATVRSLESEASNRDSPPAFRLSGNVFRTEGYYHSTLRSVYGSVDMRIRRLSACACSESWRKASQRWYILCFHKSFASEEVPAFALTRPSQLASPCPIKWGH